MKNKIFLLTTTIILGAYAAYAQSSEQNFYDDILISDEVKQQDAENQAKESAAQLLDSKPSTPNAGINKARLRSESIKNAQQMYGEAPLGLTWGASQQEIEQSGVILTPTELKDYTHCFKATNLPESNKEFASVIVVFGDDNKLWRVLVRTQFITGDSANGTKTLKQYNRFYDLLAKKYGNAQQFYTQLDENDNIIPNASPDKNPNLLSNMELGVAELYATFEGDNVGVALSVNVDGDMQSYMTIDYKNLKILKENEVELFQSL